jgi:hypothetical protein
MKFLPKNKFFLGLLVCLVIIPLLIPAKGAPTFTKNWSTNKGSLMNVTITPDSAEFSTNDIYNFLVTIKATAFGTNVDRFYDIYIELQFNNAIADVSSSGTGGPMEITSIGTSKSKTINLVIPNADYLNLDYFDTISGTLEYKIDFKEGIILDFDTSLTTNWDTITTGAIANSDDVNVIVGVLFIFALIGVGVVIFLVLRGRKGHENTQLQHRQIQYQTPISTAKEDPYRPNNQEPNILFCPNCGMKLESPMRFCSSCGHKLED